MYTPSLNLPELVVSKTNGDYNVSAAYDDIELKPTFAQKQVYSTNI